MTMVVQRWLGGRDSYRPAGEVIDVRRHEVALVPDDRTAKSFVVGHHYSGSYPAARYRVGLYERGELVGVAVFSHPTNALALRPLPTTLESVELGRFVLLDRVAGNGETLHNRSIAKLRARERASAPEVRSLPEARRPRDREGCVSGRRRTCFLCGQLHTGRCPRCTNELRRWWTFSLGGPATITVEGASEREARRRLAETTSDGSRGREPIVETFVGSFEQLHERMQHRRSGT